MRRGVTRPTLVRRGGVAVVFGFFHSPRLSPLVMSLSREQVEKVALLARLKLAPAELDRMTEQIGKIVEFVDQLSELDTEGVQPLAHPLDVVNVLADDVVAESLPREKALANAPHQDGECYLVPAVLGE
jgi:aspartyl-tRNA(Asn)/glutamyl-tRNA(Gln) amidotransferase subunit C